MRERGKEKEGQRAREGERRSGRDRDTHSLYVSVSVDGERASTTKVQKDEHASSTTSSVL